jgi:UDP-glucose 4-epimerase
MNMKVLLTGGTGYIGSHTAVVLSNAGHQVFLYDNNCNSKSEVADRLAQIVGYPIPFIKADTRDTAILIDALISNDIDAVIHFAGLKAVGESSTMPIEYYSANVQGTISLLQAMEKAEVHKLVFSSSACVYGDPQYLPIDELHPTNPTNPYGRNKLQIEQLLQDVAQSDLGRADQSAPWSIASLRYFNPVGAHESGLIGEDPQGIPNNLMPFVAQVAVGKLPALNIFGDNYETPDGTGVRDYIHIMDLAQGHLAALNYLSLHTGLTTINLGTGTGYSVLEMVKAFEVVSGRSISYQIQSRRPGDIASCYAKADKALQDLQWKARRDLASMCQSAWAWQTYCATLPKD